MTERKSQLQVLQETELELVKEFHRICEENRLRYVLAFGTMIGCVRHGGFIPWDDDIDVVMPWEDYCKFNEIANAVANPEYMVFNPNTVSRYSYPFAKFIKKKSCAIFEYPFKHYFNQPIYIDIFPAFYVPENKKKLKRVQAANFFLGQSGRMKTLGPFLHTKRGLPARIGMLMFYCLNKLAPQDFYYSRMQKKALSVTEEEASAYYIGDMYSETNAIIQFQMPLNVFDHRKLMKFEDTKLYMSADHDAILTKMYGNYMQLPPEEKRKVHGFIYASDKMSYQEYDLQHKSKK